MSSTPALHPTAIVESRDIGPGCRIDAFAQVSAGAVLRAGVHVGTQAQVEPGVHVAEGCELGPGVRLCSGLRLEAGVRIGAGAAFVRGEGTTLLRSRVQIGENATILPGLTLGVGCMVMPGAVVTRDVPPNAIVTGNPAHISGYRDTRHAEAAGAAVTSSQADALPLLQTRGPALIRLPKIVDLRGALSFGETGNQLPFTPQRFFMVYDVPNREVRGEHAHKACHQFLVCVKGSVGIVVDDGQHRDEVTLDSPRLGLHIPPMVWGIQYQFSSDAVLLVLASDCYAADDYIRNYDDFLAAVKGAAHGR